MPESQSKNRYAITLSAAEWASLVICANAGAQEIEIQGQKAGQGKTANQITLYCGQAVKIIHAALPIQDAAPARAPSVDASDDIPGEKPPA